jgi:Cu-Zn family superoxide dismutase
MRLVLVVSVVAASLAAGCANDGASLATRDHGYHPPSRGVAPTSGAWEGVSEAVAAVHGFGKTKIRGFVTFIETSDGVRVVADIEGLKPDAKHAFHIHEFGDVSSADGKTAGPHYNPEGHKHGGPDGGPHHAGDLGNLQTDAEGRARYNRVIEGISVAGDRNPVVGRSVIIHLAEDDLVTDPAGNAGDRIAGGVIGVSKPGETHAVPGEGKKSRK